MILLMMEIADIAIQASSSSGFIKGFFSETDNFGWRNIKRCLKQKQVSK